MYVNEDDDAVKWDEIDEPVTPRFVSEDVLSARLERDPEIFAKCFRNSAAIDVRCTSSSRPQGGEVVDEGDEVVTAQRYDWNGSCAWCADRQEGRRRAKRKAAAEQGDSDDDDNLTSGHVPPTKAQLSSKSKRSSLQTVTLDRHEVKNMLQFVHSLLKDVCKDKTVEIRWDDGGNKRWLWVENKRVEKAYDAISVHVKHWVKVLGELERGEFQKYPTVGPKGRDSLSARMRRKVY